MNQEQKKAMQALKTSKGQIDGIIKMLEDGRYCIDVSNQIMAAGSLLKKANMLVNHLLMLFAKTLKIFMKVNVILVKF